MNIINQLLSTGGLTKSKLPLTKVLNVNGKAIDLTRPNIMGILNLTKDSFFDGGKYSSVNLAMQRAEEMIEEGAQILDIGAESTRPGAPIVSVHEEIDRLSSVLEKIHKNRSIIISIDTSKPRVMEEMIKKFNVDIINDVRALRERDDCLDSLEILAQANIPVILMHMQGRPRNMQREPKYEHVINDIYHFFEHRIAVCLKFGIKRHNLLIDPGFGFGKSWYDNASLLKYLAKFQPLQCPLVVGVSRKSLISQNGKNVIPVEQRLPGSLALATMAIERGASIIRTHDVAATKQTVDLAFSVLEEGNCIDE